MEYQTIPQKIKAFQIQKPINETPYPQWFEQAVFAGRIATYPEHDSLVFSSARGCYEKAYPTDWLCIDDKSRIFKKTDEEFQAQYEVLNG